MRYDFSNEALLHPARLPVFAGANERPPFDPQAPADALGNVWWLAGAAQLAYRPPAGVAPELARIGWELIEFFDAGGAEAFLAAGPGFGVLAFRGTQHTDEQDLKTDAAFFLTPIRKGDRGGNPDAALVGAASERADGDVTLTEIAVPDGAATALRTGEAVVLPAGAARVHRGFQESLDGIWARMDARLTELAGRGLPVWYTGHSLGGALATLAAARRPPAALVTFGSPRVGDAGFAQRLAGVEIRRFVNCCDIVATVPPDWIGYRHVGRLCFLTSGGRLRLDPPFRRVFYDQVIGVVRFVTRLPWFRRGMVKVRFLADHALPNYVAGIEREAGRRGVRAESDRR